MEQAEKILLHDRSGQPREFAVRTEGAGVTLLRCLDAETVQLDIPAEIGGKPVTAIGESCFFGCQQLTDITLPETLQTVGEGAFAMCKSLRAVILPDSVTEVGAAAFRDCRSLKSVRLSAGMRRLRSSVFSFCRLSDVAFEVPEGLEIIESHAFYDGGWFTLHLPDSVRGIQTGAFYMGPKAVTRLPYDKGWYLDFPYGEAVLLADGTSGTVTGYKEGGDGCLILSTECGGRTLRCFYPDADGSYMFADVQSQARMERFAKEIPALQTRYEAFRNGWL